MVESFHDRAITLCLSYCANGQVGHIIMYINTESKDALSTLQFPKMPWSDRRPNIPDAGNAPQYRNHFVMPWMQCEGADRCGETGLEVKGD